MYSKNVGGFVYQAFRTRTQQLYWSGKIIYCKSFEFFDCPAVLLSSNLLLQYVCLNEEK